MDKTEGLWLGSYQGRNDHPDGISFKSDFVKVLGIYIGNVDVSHLNWDEKLNKFEITLNRWRQRDLTYCGKTVVFNSIASSGIWYTSTVQHVPNYVINRFNVLLDKFFWGHKRHLVKKDVLYQEKDKGGQGIVNISKKIQAQRAMCIVNMLQCEHKCATLFKYFIGSYRNANLNFDILYCKFNVHGNNIFCSNMPVLYREMLKAWEILQVRPSMTKCRNKWEILAQPLFGNILMKGNNIWVKQLAEHGIIRICHIWNEGKQAFYVYEEILAKYKLNFVLPAKYLYNKLLKLLPASWKILLKGRKVIPKLGLNFCIKNNCFKHGVLSHEKFQTKTLYNLLLCDSVPNCVNRWRCILDDSLQVKYIFGELYRQISDKYVLDLVWKFRHLSLPSADFLLKCKLVQNDLCSYCQERETNIHIFVDCPIAKNLWQKIEPILQSVTNKNMHCTKLYNICFGFNQCRKFLSNECILLCNFIIHTGVLVLWSCRNKMLKNQRADAWNFFIQFVKARIKNEYQMATIDMKRLCKFKDFWCQNNALCSLDDGFNLMFHI